MANTILTGNTFFFEPDLQLRVVKRDPEIPYRLHSHEFYELVFVIGGNGINFTQSEEQPIREGTVFFISPGIEHGYRNTENLVLYNVLIGKNLFAKNFLDLSELPGFQSLFCKIGSIPYLQVNPSQQAELIPTLQLMKTEADDQLIGTGSKTMAYSCLLILLVSLSRIYDEIPRDNNQVVRRLSGVIDFMERNRNRPLTTKELTQVANMSTSTLNRYFQHCTALSPIEFHTHKRIAYACSLIQEGNLSMSEIAQATGFSDANYFSRQFRKVMGMSPKQYQRIWTNKLN
ncbi:DNA-binding domain-containing protein, AraC-type [Sphaerochaeta pleomorpha str. Grapes]|uniref:DNA-binding domain-containing protein, AraC-type n=1 Tax=Sphaerochaeta pleomorpha (strain ATCC BAA-1885 / DSM 22778 / Grapes) TaxID=158190 RepID=G8QV46_SPHPG|nr:AraC family transcriptional regulator [Sphaerochaeta pleomorpha]AEV29282.1 DNA-binding domain-containing protein, AraC-type [Sphaerochaeta pleomorpha str. Grapes]